MQLSELPFSFNVLELRGGGEGGTTTGAHGRRQRHWKALAELGVEDVEMPAAAERVWRAIRDA